MRSRLRTHRLTSMSAVFVCFLLVAMPAAPASAHTELDGSVPASGARLLQLPTQAVLRFSADIATDFAQMTLKRPGASSLRPSHPDRSGRSRHQSGGPERAQ